MSLQDQMMENYNYWRDSRVQASMFSSVWKIVEQGQRAAVVSFDDYWIVECLPESLGEFIFESRTNDEEGAEDAAWMSYVKSVGERFKAHGGYTYTLEVSIKYEVCGLCRGSGKVTNPNIDCGGISQEDFDEDPDFEEAYFSGRYDQTCSRCKGRNVEAHPQFPTWLAEAIASHDEGQWDSIREQCSERAMGA